MNCLVEALGAWHSFGWMLHGADGACAQHCKRSHHSRAVLLLAPFQP